jgi:hypothetical protein
MNQEPIGRDELSERARQLRQWLESEARVLSVDDVTEIERERMEERAETARLLEALAASVPDVDSSEVVTLP